MATRAEAIALAQANAKPNIDSSVAQVATLAARVSARTAAVYQLPAVLAAQAQVTTWTATLQQRIADGIAAPAVQTPIANWNAAQETLRSRQANLQARLNAINAYFDEVDRRAVTAPVVAVPPPEAA